MTPGGALVLVAVVLALVLASLPEVAVDSEREEVLLVLLGRAALPGPLLAFFPVDSIVNLFLQEVDLHLCQCTLSSAATSQRWILVFPPRVLPHLPG